MSPTTARRTNPLPHALRVPTFTVAATALALAAHAGPGTVVPRPVPLLLAVAVVAVLASAFAHRERRFLSLLAGMALAQACLHVALSGDPGAGHSDHPWAMTAAHALAALLATCWLRRGEAAAWRALRRVVRAVRLLRAATAHVVRRRRPLCATTAPAVRRDQWHRGPAPLRGPPHPVMH